MGSTLAPTPTPAPRPVTAPPRATSTGLPQKRHTANHDAANECRLGMRPMLEPGDMRRGHYCCPLSDQRNAHHWCPDRHTDCSPPHRPMVLLDPSRRYPDRVEWTGPCDQISAHPATFWLTAFAAYGDASELGNRENERFKDP